MHKWRRPLAWALAILATLFALLTPIAVWTRNQLLNTDRYVDTVAPLATDPAVQAAVANRVATTLSDAVDVKSIAEDALPSRAEFLGGAIATAFEELVRQTTQRILASEQFEELWKEVNRRAHDQIDALLTGDTTGVEIENGAIVLDLGVIVERVRLALADAGIGVFDNVPVEKLAVKFTLFRSSSLEKAQNGVDLLNTLANVLPFLMVGAYVGAVIAAPDRRRMLLWCGVLFSGAMVLLGIGIALGRTFYLDALPADANREAAEAAFDIVVRYLRTGIRVLLVLGLLVGFGAWLAGPSSVARRVRGAFGSGAERTAALAEGRVERNPVADWIAKYVVALRVALVALGTLVLVFANHPTPLMVFVVALIVIVALFVLEVVRRAAGPPVTAQEGERDESSSTRST
jgi:hypothetical protein